MAAGTSPSAIHDPASGYTWVFYQGSNGELWEAIDPGTGWGEGPRGGAMAADTSPSAIDEEGDSRLSVFYQGTEGQIWEAYQPGAGWSEAEL